MVLISNRNKEANENIVSCIAVNNNITENVGLENIDELQNDI